MAYTITPLSGIDFSDTTTVAELALTGGTAPAFGPIGAEVFGSDGRRYVFAKAGATITATSPSCAINVTTFVASATGGTYLSPTASMGSGDYGWFSAASV